MTSAKADMPAQRRTRLAASPAAIILAMGAVCALLLALPGETVATKSLDELFLIFDGIHRMTVGQAPFVDFGSDYGPLALIAPTLAFRLTGSYGLAMPLAMAGFTLVVAFMASHVLTSRLRPFLAISFSAFLLLILCVPMSLGDPVTALSFARFDLRIGWVCLALLLVLYLRPTVQTRSNLLADVSCAVLLTLILVYTRATYAAVAIAVLLLMLTDRRQARMAALVLALAAAILLVVHLTSSSAPAYLAHSWQALRSDGLLGGSLWAFFQRGLAHLADFLLLGVLAGLALWTGFGLRHLLFFLIAALGGLFVISHTIQPWGIISMHAAAVVAAELLLRRMDRKPHLGQGQIVNAGGVKLFFLAFTLPTSLHCALALSLHAGAATVRAGDPVSLPLIDRVRLADLWTTGDWRGQTWYLGLIGQGFDLLDQDTQPIGRFVAVGEVDVFSTALNLTPPARQTVDMRWSRLKTAEPPLQPATVIGDAETVLYRKTNESDPNGLPQRLLETLRQDFAPAGESEHWLLFRRAAPGTARPGPDAG